MKLLKTIKDSDIFPELKTGIEVEEYKERKAARAIIFDQEKNVAILNVSKSGYYKLPGGGVEEGEDMIEALHRECIEEMGCSVKVEGEVGQIIEYRNQNSLRQVSSCYTARVDGSKGNPDFEQGEIDEGFQGMWVTLDEALDLMKQSKPTTYDGKFIMVRDSCFLEAVKAQI